MPGWELMQRVHLMNRLSLQLFPYLMDCALKKSKDNKISSLFNLFQQ